MAKGTVRLHRVLKAKPERVYRAFFRCRGHGQVDRPLRLHL
jgi:uncharacterized protein YndB with AHSA1/START domain